MSTLATAKQQGKRIVSVTPHFTRVPGAIAVMEGYVVVVETADNRERVMRNLSEDFTTSDKPI